MLPWLIPLFLFHLSNACAIFMLNTNSYINKVMAFNYRVWLGEQVTLLWDQTESKVTARLNVVKTEAAEHNNPIVS